MKGMRCSIIIFLLWAASDLDGIDASPTTLQKELVYGITTNIRPKRSYDSRNDRNAVKSGSSSSSNASPSSSSPSSSSPTSLQSMRFGGVGAVFATANSTSILAQIGGTARLPCVVRKFNNGVVSWLRKDDSPPTILSVGLEAHIADDRFLVEHARHLQNWDLVIKHVRRLDAGLYECQVSTHPTTSIFIELRVTEASAEIMGVPDLHVRAGSTLNLVCTIRQSTEAPAYVFWYHDRKMINHEPGVKVSIEPSSSVLHLAEADTSHSGNYTCHPSNAIPAHINVHILNATEEENPAAMLHASSSSISDALFMSVILIVTVNIALTFNS